MIEPLLSLFNAVVREVHGARSPVDPRRSVAKREGARNNDEGNGNKEVEKQERKRGSGAGRGAARKKEKKETGET